jgi:hypothetical protein
VPHEPANGVFEVPALVFVCGIAYVVDVVMNFSPEVEIVSIPARKVAGAQIFFR